MELDQLRPDNPAMTFDEASMERSKSFVKALQVLSSNFFFFIFFDLCFGSDSLYLFLNSFSLACLACGLYVISFWLLVLCFS